MAWARLDDRFHQNAKVLSLTDPEFRLYVVAITYCASEQSNGRITRAALLALCRLHSVKPRAVDALIGKRCIDRDAEGFRVHDFEEYAAPDVRNARSLAGRKGAATRWHSDSHGDGKPMARAIDASMAAAMHDDGSRTRARAHPGPSRPVPAQQEPLASAHGSGDDEALPSDQVRALVAHFVDACTAVGVEPIDEQRARVGRMAKKLTVAGKDAELVEQAIDRMVERNRPPESLPYLVGEIERERAGKSPLPPLLPASPAQTEIADLAQRYTSEASA